MSPFPSMYNSPTQEMEGKCFKTDGSNAIILNQSYVSANDAGSGSDSNL
jgi:hypothetical protein